QRIQIPDQLAPLILARSALVDDRAQIDASRWAVDASIATHLGYALRLDDLIPADLVAADLVARDVVACEPGGCRRRTVLSFKLGNATLEFFGALAHRSQLQRR